MQWIRDLLKWLGMGRHDSADSISKAYERLVTQQEKWRIRTDERLDECDEDRHVLRKQLTDVEIKLAKCDEERFDLATRVAVLEAKTTTDT